jgi:DNA topoisomerase-2
MITPIIKVMKNKKVIKQFYNTNDYKVWKESNNITGTYEKYYKGLGTSNSTEAKEYFANLSLNRKRYVFDKSKDLQFITNTFDKEYADERKTWITDYLVNQKKGDSAVDYNKTSIGVEYFINKELVQFSVYDNVRSIPSVIDGLKPCQRKILYTCLRGNLFLKKNGSGEIKVLELAGDVMKHSSYHHGDTSLHGTIIGMAQNFVGSQYSTNNINLLLPLGAFGTRISGGDDAASPRYINTALREEVGVIFNETDNLLLNYIEEEGKTIEPDYYVPIIPMILVNGASGIGTGWSTDIPCFNPIDIINSIKLLLDNEDAVLDNLTPYYNGYKGTILKISENKWKTFGRVEKINETTVEITELPVGMWIQSFKEYLDGLLTDKKIKDTIISDDDASKTANDVCYQVVFNESIADKDEDYFIKFFKLEKNINGTNMVAFDENKVIQKYGSVEDILWTFYKYRLNFYEKRYNYIRDSLEKQIKEISEELRFVLLVVSDEIVVFKKTKTQISEILTEYKFENQKYLLAMSLHKFTKEEVDELTEKLENVKKSLAVLLSKTKKDLWREDLDALVKEL